MAEKGVWRTISGRRVFIGEGQTLSEAMSKSGKFGNKKVSSRKNLKLNDYRKMSVEELDRLDSKLFGMNKQKLRDEGLNAESRYQKLVYELGLNDKPKVLPAKEFDRLSKGQTLVYRGVKDVSKLDSNLKIDVIKAKDIHNQMKYGDKMYVGDGSFGDGLYFTDSEGTAKRYGGDNAKNVATAFIDSNKIKSIEFDKLSQMRQEYYSKQFEPGGKKVSSLFSDISSFALYEGYNVIIADGGFGESYYNVLDRSILVIKEEEE